MTQRVFLSLSESFTLYDVGGCADWGMKTGFFDKGNYIRVKSLTALCS
jgi:hypothetical protein